MKKISIIIPCYNAEKYISICIESLVNQTIGVENLELIFVNDASSDNTLNILYEWEKKYPESILIVDCKSNGKQGRARNIGLSYASSEYIGFMDNDDIIQSCMFEKLYEKAKAYDCDLVVCRSWRHTIEEANNCSAQRVKEGDFLGEITGDGDRIEFLYTDINLAIWNKMYKKSIILDNKVFFPEGCIYDDIFFSGLIKHYVSSVYIVEELLYHHIEHRNACSNSNDINIRLSYIDVHIMLINELKNRGLYNQFYEFYEEEYLNAYFKIIYTLLQSYSFLSLNVLNEIRDKSLEIFPCYREKPFSYKGVNEEIYKVIYDSFKMESIDEKYIQKLRVVI